MPPSAGTRGQAASVRRRRARHPITGTDLDRATAAALQATGGGRVTGTELGDEESMYEVEVTLDDGSQVDVQLDEQFRVVSNEADSEDDARRRLTCARLR